VQPLQISKYRAWVKADVNIPILAKGGRGPLLMIIKIENMEWRKSQRNPRRTILNGLLPLVEGLRETQNVVLLVFLRSTTTLFEYHEGNQ
jgi:hypothetical protein